MVGQLRGFWRDVLEGGEQGVERADYADIEAPIKRMFVDGPSSVTLLDRGRRLSFRLTAVGLGDLTVHAADETCGLRDWDEFIYVGFSLHTFPALRSLSLLFIPTHYRFIALCSSLTSLALWHPNAFALHSLASPSTPLHRSLTSLTIHNAWLEAALKPLASFPRLASLSFLSCTIDPCDLHALSRSLHTLTHLTIHDCPMIPSHSLAALAESNPSLSSLSLHSTSYLLFIPHGLRDLFLSSSSRLHSLTLSGLPSYRPGMLARCSSLQRLTLRGREAERGSFMPSSSPQKPSLDCIVAMLVQVEQLGVAEGPEGGGDGVERWEGATEAAAGRAEFVAAMDNWLALSKTSQWKLIKAATEALRWRHLHHGAGALHLIHRAVIHVRSAILLCRCVRLAKAEMKGWSEREDALAKACRAAGAAGVFAAAVEEQVEVVEQEREVDGWGVQWIEAEEVARYMPEDDLEDDLAVVSEKLLAWVVVPQADAREVLHALMEVLLLEMEDMGARFEIHDPAQPHPAILPGVDEDERSFEESSDLILQGFPSPGTIE
ncbi:unnamed protein product [Closterium sp. Yama58-4]|nr:unnamed protein product [Closterium sp. Yama58-4]